MVPAVHLNVPLSYVKGIGVLVSLGIIPDPFNGFVIRRFPPGLFIRISLPRPLFIGTHNEYVAGRFPDIVIGALPLSEPSSVGAFPDPVV